MSARASSGSPGCICSGAMYSGVPMMPREAGPLADVTSPRSASTILARPKSPTFTKPSSPPPVRRFCCIRKMFAAFRSQQVIERFALDVFHHEEEHAFRALAEVVDVDDVRMTNRRGGASFALEARDGFAFLQIFVVENVRADCFDGDLPREQVLIAREINLAHRTAPETFLEQVSRREQSRTGQRVLRIRLILRADLDAVFVANLATGTLTHRTEF